MRIAPIGWRHDRNADYCWARTQFGHMEICIMADGHWYADFSWDASGIPFKGAAEAKAYAERIYRDRVMASLLPVWICSLTAEWERGTQSSMAAGDSAVHAYANAWIEMKGFESPFRLVGGLMMTGDGGLSFEGACFSSPRVNTTYRTGKPLEGC